MYISQLLQTLVVATLDDAGDKCYPDSTALVDCLTAQGLSKAESESCILCPISNAKNSRATTCAEFEAEGFCDDVAECEHSDCPGACWAEFDRWLTCKCGQIGCPDICQHGSGLGFDAVYIA